MPPSGQAPAMRPRAKRLREMGRFLDPPAGGVLGEGSARAICIGARIFAKTTCVARFRSHDGVSQATPRSSSSAQKRVLRCPRPTDKSLGDSLIGSPPAEELGKGGSCQAVHRDRSGEGEEGQALAARKSFRGDRRPLSSDVGIRRATSGSRRARTRRCSSPSTSLAASRSELGSF
jgi:hypothetical protein